MSLFPLISLPEITGSDGTARPLFREVAWDFRANKPIWRGGEPVYVTGASAVLVWCWNTLHTLRGMHDIYTRDYGLGILDLRGRAYTEDIRQSEAIRYVREALLVCPYVTAVDSISIEMNGAMLVITCTIQTVYGEVNVDGCTI